LGGVPLLEEKEITYGVCPFFVSKQTVKYAVKNRIHLFLAIINCLEPPCISVRVRYYVHGVSRVRPVSRHQSGQSILKNAEVNSWCFTFLYLLGVVLNMGLSFLLLKLFQYLLG